MLAQQRASYLGTRTALTLKATLVFVMMSLGLAGCAPSQEFAAIPGQIDRDHVRKQSVTMTAERFKFVPDTIRVKAGTLVQVQVTSTEGSHGFQLGAFGIDVPVDEHETKSSEFYAAKRGTYGFRCSHFCGLGHMGMHGLVIVE